MEVSTPKYLQDLAEFFELPVREKAEVVQIAKKEGSSLLKQKLDHILKNVIWAAGEFFYPKLGGFP